MVPDRVLRQLSQAGAAAQATVPGLYAWAVSVAPAAFARGAPKVAVVAAVVAGVALPAGVWGERRFGQRGRFASLWLFVLASALVWSMVPSAMAPLKIGAARGTTGMLAWAVFALASAAPALGGGRGEEHLIAEELLSPRKRLAGWDAAYVAGGAIVAVALQFAGWRVASPERALLVRFIALGAGIAIVGAATDIALARHVPRAPRHPRRRIRSAVAMLALLGILTLSGLLFALRD